MVKKKIERGRTYTQNFVDNFTSDSLPESKKFKNLTGLTFGSFTVLKYIERIPPHSYWFCQCKCGRIEKHSTNVLNRGKSKCHYCAMKDLSVRLTIPKDVAIREIKELHPSYELLDFDKQLWHCLLCKSDFRLPLKSYRSGKRSCYCNKMKPLSKEANLNRVMDVCKEKDYQYLGYDGDFIGNKTYVKLICNKCGHTWSSNINNLIRGYGCEPCSKKRAGEKNKHNPSVVITGGKKVHGCKYNYDNFQYINSRTPSAIFCNTCKKTFKQSYDNHVNKGKGCPTCSVGGYSSSITGNFYIQLLGLDYIKFGITNRNPYTRMSEQQEKSDFRHQLLVSFSSRDGEVARKVETAVKRLRFGGGVDRDRVPDGFSETCSIKHLQDIFNIAHKYFKDNKNVEIKNG